MFVRYRRQGRRLQASVVESRRVGKKVISEHLGGLGSVDADFSIGGRRAFWDKLPQRFDRIANGIDPAERTKLHAELQARIPMVSPEEQLSPRIGDEGAVSDSQIFPTPTEDDIRVMQEALGDDPTFAGLPEAGKAAFFAGIGIKWVAGIYDDVGEQYRIGKHAKFARDLQKLKAGIRL